MKKLMIAAAALTAGIAMADGIVSSDIVGYAQKQLQSGATMTGYTFVPVSDSSLSIQDISVNGDAGEGDVNIQTLTSTGRTLAMYTYYAENVFDDGMPAGWYDDDGLANVTFEHGQGLWVAAADSNTTLTFAGKVPTSDVVVVLQSGATATANVMPTSVSIQDIVVTGDAGEGDVNIQTLTSTGRTLAMYTYYAENVFDDGMSAGWYDDDGLADVTFESGQGLWVAAGSSSATIRIPAPEL